MLNLLLFDGKLCRDCGCWKPFAELKPDRAMPDGYKFLCNLCGKERQRAWRAKNAKAPVVPDGKTCKKCGVWKSIEEFGSSIGTLDGRESRCKECSRQRHRQYIAANRELVNERSRVSYWLNPVKRREAVRKSHAKHPEQAAKWLEKPGNREKRREIHRRYAKNHPEKRAANSARWRALRMNAPVVQKIKRAFVIERDNSTCYLCGKRLGDNPRELHLDHVIPLSRGGMHTYDNLKVCCRSCNGRKRMALLSELEARGIKFR